MIQKGKVLGNGDSMKSLEEKRQSTNLMSSKSLWSRLRRGLEARSRFVESHLNKNLAFQIRIMRDQAKWSQEKLAETVGMNQNAISRLENPGYGKATLTTLKRIASAFDVALIVRFVPYSQLVSWVSGTPFLNIGLSSESLGVLNFSQETLAMQQNPAPLGPIRVRALRQTRELELGSFQTQQTESSARAQAGANKQRAA